MTLIFVVILVALVFEYINGFHDTANSIATVVSTKVLTPRQAIVMSASTNLLGALLWTAVAKTIAGGLVDTSLFNLTSPTLICALFGAIAWDLLTWYVGLPTSSSHALVGGLCGAALAAAHGNWHVIIWSQPNAVHWYKGKGLLWKVIAPMFLSPLLGLVIGFLLMTLALHCLAQGAPAPGQHRVRQAANFQRRRHGPDARHQRRPKNHGHDYPRPARRDQARGLSIICRPGLPFCACRSRPRATTLTF